MRVINRTIYGSALQTSLMFDLPLAIKENTTLNEKFGILENEELENNVLPKVKYFCIGNRGHRFISGTDNIPYPQPVQHKASDAALYNHMPFVMRELDNDLTIAERENYALRKKITVDGIEYYAYYLKRIDMEPTQQIMQHVNVQDGEETMTPFEPDEDVLSPEPSKITSDDTIKTEGNYLSISALIELTFDESDVDELLNVSDILYNSYDMAIVSEIGLCSGVDKITVGDLDGDNVNYKEAMAVQVVSFITGFYSMSYSNQGFKLEVEAGATEPLLGAS